MSLCDPIQSRAACARPHRYLSGMSLVELTVTMAISSIVLVILGLLSLYGLRSFMVMGNTAALDDKNRFTAGQISRDLREATAVVRYDTDEDGATLTVTNSLDGYNLRYTWDGAARTLTRVSGDEPARTALVDCDTWQASFFQNVPHPSATQPYLLATNGAGSLDLTKARVLQLYWKCSRPVLGSPVRTESAQTLRILLRNPPAS